MRNIVRVLTVTGVAIGTVGLTAAAGLAEPARGGPHNCQGSPPGYAFIRDAAHGQTPIAGPNDPFTWGPTRDGAPNAPGQAVVGFCILGLD